MSRHVETGEVVSPSRKVRQEMAKKYNLLIVDDVESLSGVYFYQMQAGDPSAGSGQSFVDTKKLLLLK